MATCTSCGRDVTGKKFCPDCGAAVQVEPATATCPRCNGSVKAGAAFCMHCGSSLGAQALAATTAGSLPIARQCTACRAEVPSSSAFCTNCGQNMQTGQTPAPVAAAPVFCNSCGSQNNPGARFCNSCGQGLVTGVPSQAGSYQPYPQQPSQYPSQPYPQQPSQYPSQPYMQQQSQYGQQPYGVQPQYSTNYSGQQPYAQGGYGQPDPALGQQPMVLRCPVCRAMAPMGTPSCPSCRTSLAGVVPAPATAAAAAQGQQQGGLGNFMQGDGGKYAMGALGGAAAVIGGEMLLHGVERNLEEGGGDGYEGRHHHREEGLLGGLGNLGNDIGLF
jgi:hypothetical protein